MEIDQALDHVTARPGEQFSPMPPVASNSSGHEPGNSTGRPIQLPLASSRASALTMAIVDDGAEAHAAAQLRHRAPPGHESLEICNAFIVAASGGRDLLELSAMIEGENADVAGMPLHRCRAMQRRDALVPSGRAGGAVRDRNSSSSALSAWRACSRAG